MDCAQLTEYIPKTSEVLDIGSGAGLPGIILTINGINKITLLEPNLKKSAFLRYISGELGVDCNVIPIGMNDYKHPRRVDYIVSRAFSNVANIISGCLHNITTDTRIILLKSDKQVEEEIKQAKRKYNFFLQIFNSKISNEGRIIIISNISPND
jgi:16S rRNA (guanine527-N7)-methyltransferase